MSHSDNWTENFFNSNGGHIRYFRTGGDKPSLILLHGAMNNGLCWSRVAKSLENDFNIIMPDARGHGKSVSFHNEFTYKEMINDTVELIEYLEVAPIILMGHSMGAQIATELGARFPNLVKKLVLEDPGYYFKNPTFLDLLYYKWMRNKIKKYSLAQIRELCDKSYEIWHEDDKILWAIARKEWAENESKSKSFDPKRNWHDIFPEIKAPTLLIISDKGLVKRSEAERYVREFSKAKYEVIENAGHHIHQDNLNAFMKIVQDFLE